MVCSCELSSRTARCNGTLEFSSNSIPDRSQADSETMFSINQSINQEF